MQKNFIRELEQHLEAILPTQDLQAEIHRGRRKGAAQAFDQRDTRICVDAGAELLQLDVTGYANTCRFGISSHHHFGNRFSCHSIDRIEGFVPNQIRGSFFVYGYIFPPVNVPAKSHSCCSSKAPVFITISRPWSRTLSTHWSSAKKQPIPKVQHLACCLTLYCNTRLRCSMLWSNHPSNGSERSGRLAQSMRMEWWSLSARARGWSPTIYVPIEKKIPMTRIIPWTVTRISIRYRLCISYNSLWIKKSTNSLIEVDITLFSLRLQ